MSRQLGARVFNNCATVLNNLYTVVVGGDASLAECFFCAVETCLGDMCITNATERTATVESGSSALFVGRLATSMIIFMLIFLMRHHVCCGFQLLWA